MRFILFLALGVLSIGFSFVWLKNLIKTSKALNKTTQRTSRLPTLLEFSIGFVTDFLDTLGIGSFAVTTALFKLTRVVADEDIPGTLNVGHTIPTFIEAFIFIAIVAVGIKTLVFMIFAAMIGSWIGAGVVSSLPRRKIQIGMGIALIIAAGIFLMSNFGLFPAGGAEHSLTGTRLLLAVLGNFILGALMTLGIGLYAPCMILVSLLGMNPQTAFPIMMGSCAFLMPIATVRFIKKERYSPGPALGLTLGGIPAVLIAAYIVKSLPLTVLRWLVILVVIYTAVSMLRSAATAKK